MSKCLVSGSFDPITIGHLDIIKKAAKKFDQVVVGVFVNEQKQYIFDIDTRCRLCKIAVEQLSNVEVISSTGMVVDFCKVNKIDAIVRGFRNCVDYQYETEMAVYNYVNSGVMTYLIAADSKLMNVSSSLVREYLKNDVFDYVNSYEVAKKEYSNKSDNQSDFDVAQADDSIEKCLPKSVLDEIRRMKNA